MCMAHQDQFQEELQTKIAVFCSQVQPHSSIWCCTAPKQTHISTIDSQSKMPPFLFFLKLGIYSMIKLKQWKREVPPIF